MVFLPDLKFGLVDGILQDIIWQMSTSTSNN